MMMENRRAIRASFAIPKGKPLPTRKTSRARAGRATAPTKQEFITRLHEFWARQGCVLVQPYNSEVGAGTLNPATFLRVLGPEPWRAAYVEPSKRPRDGRYGENPNRVQQFLQYQVVLKPPPDDVLALYLDSLRYIGIDPARHDIRLVEDDWEAPTLGAAGLGWEVWLDGMEITQFTYFQQAGSLDLEPVTAEITYGLLRLCLYLQKVDSVLNVEWAPGVSWGEMNLQAEQEFSAFHFERSNTDMYFRFFQEYEREAGAMLAAGLVLPAYDYAVKLSHVFNLLDARGAISVTERTAYIGRIRALARRAAVAYIEKREALGFPLLKRSGAGKTGAKKRGRA